MHEAGAFAVGSGPLRVGQGRLRRYPVAQPRRREGQQRQVVVLRRPGEAQNHTLDGFDGGFAEQVGTQGRQFLGGEHQKIGLDRHFGSFQKGACRDMQPHRSHNTSHLRGY
jgi:hypothetical protein